MPITLSSAHDDSEIRWAQRRVQTDTPTESWLGLGVAVPATSRPLLDALNKRPHRFFDLGVMETAIVRVRRFQDVDKWAADARCQALAGVTKLVDLRKSRTTFETKNSDTETAGRRKNAC